MLIGETMRIALQSIRGNLFRAVLTMLGIVIGVGAVITMVALGTGAQRAIDAQMQALGGDILSVGRANRFSRGVARDDGTLTTDDAAALARGSEYFDGVVPEINSRFQIKYGNRNLNLSPGMRLRYLLPIPVYLVLYTACYFAAYLLRFEFELPDPLGVVAVAFACSGNDVQAGVVKHH